MKGVRFFLILILLGAVPFSSLWSQDYIYNQEKSDVLFNLKQFGLNTISGDFAKFHGSFIFDPLNIAATSVNILISTASVQAAGAAKLVENQVRGLFDPELFPHITFLSEKVKQTHPDKYEIWGQLTIRGVTKPTIFYTELGETLRDAEGNEIPIFISKAYIDRREFGLVDEDKSADALSGIVAGNQVEIILKVEGVPHKAATPAASN